MIQTHASSGGSESGRRVWRSLLRLAPPDHILHDPTTYKWFPIVAPVVAPVRMCKRIETQPVSYACCRRVRLCIA